MSLVFLLVNGLEKSLVDIFMLVRKQKVWRMVLAI